MSCSSEDDIPLKEIASRKKAQGSRKRAAPKEKSSDSKEVKPARNAKKPRAAPKAKAAAPVQTLRRKKGVSAGGAPAEEEEVLPNDARRFFKHGQKFITPPNGDGTRAFYESLYDENRNSLVAIKYCVEWGVLTGTLLHESLPKYFALRERGAFKGAGGGLQKEFLHGPSQAELEAAAKILAVRSSNKWNGELLAAINSQDASTVADLLSPLCAPQVKTRPPSTVKRET